MLTHIHRQTMLRRDYLPLAIFAFDVCRLETQLDDSTRSGELIKSILLLWNKLSYTSYKLLIGCRPGAPVQSPAFGFIARTRQKTADSG